MKFYGQDTELELELFFISVGQEEKHQQQPLWLKQYVSTASWCEHRSFPQSVQYAPAGLPSLPMSHLYTEAAPTDFVFNSSGMAILGNFSISFGNDMLEWENYSLHLYSFCHRNPYIFTWLLMAMSLIIRGKYRWIFSRLSDSKI